VLEDRRFASQRENPGDPDALEKLPKDLEVQIFLFLILDVEVNLVEFRVKDVKRSHATLASGGQV